MYMTGQLVINREDNSPLFYLGFYENTESKEFFSAWLNPKDMEIIKNKEDTTHLFIIEQDEFPIELREYTYKEIFAPTLPYTADKRKIRKFIKTLLPQVEELLNRKIISFEEKNHA